MRILSNQRGQGLIEYVILVALVGIATMVMVRKLQHTVNANLGRTVNALQGIKEKPQYERVEDSDFRKKDFSDFMNGTASRGSNHGEE